MSHYGRLGKPQVPHDVCCSAVLVGCYVQEDGQGAHRQYRVELQSLNLDSLMREDEAKAALSRALSERRTSQGALNAALDSGIKDIIF